MLSVIIPASNEESWIGRCLGAVLASEPVPGGVEIIVVANGCHDQTVEIARSFQQQAKAAGWGFLVLDLPQGSKPAALNAGDGAARGDMRVYLDADVSVSAPLLAQLVTALVSGQALYASGTAMIAPGRSAITRSYGRFWHSLPFARSVAPGYGLFAVNAAGRARWGAFPAIISDDTFVRLQFQPSERIQVAGTYAWPMVEGFRNLVRVRRRQDEGVSEINVLWPDLSAREAKPPLTPAHLARLAAAEPAGFVIYGLVSVAVRLGTGDGAWTRGR